MFRKYISKKYCKRDHTKFANESFKFFILLMKYFLFVSPQTPCENWGVPLNQNNYIL